MSKYLLRPLLIGTGIVLAATGPFPASKQESNRIAKPAFETCSSDVDFEWLPEPIHLRDLSCATVVSTYAGLE